jgi:hypothetical protein
MLVTSALGYLYKEVANKFFGKAKEKEVSFEREKKKEID